MEGVREEEKGQKLSYARESRKACFFLYFLPFLQP